MLYMIGYDLRRPQYYRALERGVGSVAKRVKPKGKGRGHASKCNVSFGPWLVSSDGIAASPSHMTRLRYSCGPRRLACLHAASQLLQPMHLLASK